MDTTETALATVDTTPAVTLERIVYRTTSGSSNTDADRRELRLLFLGCEAKPPYGPYEHTASLFLDLIALAIQQQQQEETMVNERHNYCYKVILDVYHVSNGHFPAPSAYQDYDGIILPGSFNAAYDTDPWILQLSKVIQDIIVAQEIPTLGVCFGHQLFAHSFAANKNGGSACKCPAGPQAGRQVSQLSPDGQKWWQKKEDEEQQLQLFYTHGDMVASLPPQGRILGGTVAVPIQAAVYLSSSKDNTTKKEEVMAVTFQAHPEYASSQALGLDRTLHPILDAMQERKDITEEEMMRAKQDAVEEFATVQRHSVDSMITAGRLLGWIPPLE